jgi:simple sugar transport system permease protein
MFGLKFEKKAAPSLRAEIGVSLLSLALALLVGSILIWAQGLNPIYVYSEMFSASFGSFSAFAKTVTKAIPLLLIGVGLALAFKAKAWNIGAPGQMIIGAIAGAGVALFFPLELSAPVHIALVFMAGFAAGAGFAAICAFLNAKIGLDMVISTLMLNYVAWKFLQHLVYGPWQKPGLGFPHTAEFPISAQLPVLAGTRIHYLTLIIGIVAAILIYLFMRRTKLGYEIRVFGENPYAAEYAGINKFKMIMLVMILSGGLAGLAGAGEVMGIHHMLQLGVDGAGAVYAASYGYVAIIVAWLGRRTAPGAVLAAFFVAGILIGGHRAQIIGLPFALVSALLGLILLSLIGGMIAAQYKITFRGGRK